MDAVQLLAVRGATGNQSGNWRTYRQVMSDPKRLEVKLGDIMDTLESIYTSQRKRGFLRPRPAMPEAGDPRLEGIPDGFLKWWQENRNCDMSPIVAWKTKYYRDKYYAEIAPDNSD